VKVQPVKFAALEGLYKGKEEAGLVVFGVLKSVPGDTTTRNEKEFAFKIEIPNFLSYMAYGNFDAYVPGINDLVDGNPERGLMSVAEKIDRGRFARESLARLKDARDKGDSLTYAQMKARFSDADFKTNYFRYFGYGFMDDPNSVIPNVPVAFYSFHIMVLLGFYFLLLLVVVLLSIYRNTIEKQKFVLWLCIFTIPLTYIASQAGWVLAEMGRQPWVIQDLLPTMAAISHINTSSVMITFFLFLILFTSLLVAELSIMFRQIKIGPK
jgi:cytochrome d ubiquinol oxidase subunit I